VLRPSLSPTWIALRTGLPFVITSTDTNAPPLCLVAGGRTAAGLPCLVRALVTERWRVVGALVALDLPSWLVATLVVVCCSSCDLA